MSEDSTTGGYPDQPFPEDATVMRHTVPQDGIGDDVRLIVDTAHGRVFDNTLIMAAISARYAGNGEITPFLYREPADPDDPDAPTPPLRRAILAIIDDRIIAP